mmetsp:Transcript_21394/g.35399  ORF Transcript_21394/g.35399 Transcript_21394/m.35399 type:complete len:314 (-) Transcript_21394:58-999(-)|eukprot:CAMPEP_0119014312 /NCGR_PEP_ID=MMETSP1176-20130426/9494_1 /TAXON_ID=265551 /ORGANISM="Synedropsis recta cf, Strain CCMP1620" /LENGTH=313 /DNA_ID=CAMNT_0006967467 /DNA_START=75 /DNA_END=1016 /DNA_ORIENTATION=+
MTPVESGAAEYGDEWKMGDPRNNDTHLGNIRDQAGKLVNAVPIQTFMTFVLIANALLMGIMTFDFVMLDPTLKWQLEWLDLSMLIAFTVEFVLQAVYLGPRFLRDGWLVFDFIVITLSWAFANSPITVLRSFRIFRIFAIISKAKNMKTLFSAMIRAVPNLISVSVVLGLFMYVFAVLFTNLYGDLFDEGYLDWDYFGRLDYTWITLFQLMTTTSWLSVVRQVMVPRPLSWIGFFFFVIITGIIVMNLFVAVVCEALVEEKAEEEDEDGKLRDEMHSTTPGVADLQRQIQESIRLHAKMQKKLNIILSRLPAP